MLSGMFSCTGTWLSPPVRIGGYSVLVLILDLPSAYAVCSSCLGAASSQGCTGSHTTCPWTTGIAHNMAVIAGTVASGTAAVFAVRKLLPEALSCLFSTKVLTAILSLTKDRTAIGSYDPTGKSTTEIIAKVRTGALAADEAISELHNRIDTMADTDPNFRNKLAKLDSTIAVVSKLKDSSLAPGTHAEGVYIFVLGRVTLYTCHEFANSTEVVMRIENQSNGEASTAEGGGNFNTKLRRPRTYDQMVATLNIYALVLQALSLSSTLAFLPFLDEVVYAPLRLKELDWPSAFEHMILYIHLVQNSVGVEDYNFGDVVSKYGARGAMLVKATAQSKMFPEYRMFFRTRGGTPLEGVGGPSATCPECVVEYSTTSKRACTAWNANKDGSNHKMRDVTCEGGKFVCKFFHGCSHWVSNKGKYGQCLSTSHARAECDNPHKCSSPKQ